MLVWKKFRLKQPGGGDEAEVSLAGITGRRGGRSLFFAKWALQKVKAEKTFDESKQKIQ